MVQYTSSSPYLTITMARSYLFISIISVLLIIRRNASTGASSTLIVDTDVGFDDLLAISALKSNKVANVPFITTVGGMQDNPDRAACYLKEIFPTTLDVVAGESTHVKNTSVPVENWLLESRTLLNSLMDSEGVPEFCSKEESIAGTSLMIAEFLETHPGSVDLMCLGPLTIVASWIESEHSEKIFIDKVKSIWIMGGNIPSKDNTQPEFNFKLDPLSMSKVIRHEKLRDKIYIVPEQTCQRQIMSNEKWNSIVNHGKKGDGVISKILAKTSDWNFLKYDALCAFAYANHNVYNGDEAAINHELLKVSIDSNKGLLLQPSHEDIEDAIAIDIKFVTNISMNEGFGFPVWLSEAIRNEQSQNF